MPELTSKERTFRLPLCRIAFHNLITPRKKKNTDDDEYSVTLIMDRAATKADPAALAAYTNAKKIVDSIVANKWGDKIKGIKTPFKNGDEKNQDIFQGQIVMDAKSKLSPQIVDGNRSLITTSSPGDPNSIYSGAYVYVNVTAYPYDVDGNKGISLALNGVQKVKDGPVLAGRPSVDQMFDDIGGEDPANYAAGAAKPAAKGDLDDL
jgi:hypothetical protein